MNLLLRFLLSLRWAYFHVHPGYTKVYMDEARSELWFFHAKTNSLHCNYRVVNI